MSLVLTKSMDQTISVGFLDEEQGVEVLSGSLTACEFRLFDYKTSSTSRIALVSPGKTFTLVAGRIEFAVLVADIVNLLPGKYWAQVSGVCSSTAFCSEAFEVLIEPKGGV